MVSGNFNPAAGEAVRKVATNLEFAPVPQGTKTLLVVSPNPGDGRTTLVANLGIALADVWNEVVLVDTDLRFPSLHHFFSLNNSVGLTNLLCDPTMSITGVVQETAHKRLKVVTSGPVPSNPLELLRCPRMAWFLEQLKETSDMVLLDAPPALAVTDALALTSRVDGAILVLDAESTRWNEVRATLKGLEKATTLVLGYIWNRAPGSPWTSLATWLREHRKPGNRPPSSITLGSGSELVGISQRPEDSAGHLASIRRYQKVLVQDHISSFQRK